MKTLFVRAALPIPLLEHRAIGRPVHLVTFVAASHEDFGLTPLEAASFGKPAAVLRWGGFLDTVVEGVSGIFFETMVSYSSRLRS